jgi:hypothetical protein
MLMEKKKKLPTIEITELFLIKADWTRTFMGIIRREVDVAGNPVVMGEVIVPEGKIWSKASSQEDLMKNMDSICKLKLDGGLHSHAGVTIKIFDTDFYLN